MGENSKIEWTDNTFNAWVGCQKVSPACDHCYAEGWAKRTGQGDLWQGERRRTSASNWKQPIKWNRQAEDAKRRARVFCSSLADVFDNQVPKEWRDDLWTLIADTPYLDWLLLTKRPQNIAKMLPDPATGVKPWGDGWPNVWLGTTAEDESEYVRRWNALARIPAGVRFISYEPVLGPIASLRLGELPVPDWLICGGESGRGARPMHPDWARSIRDQCAAAGVPFFFKQWGEWHPCEMAEGGVCYPMPGHAPFDSWKAPIFDTEIETGWNWRKLGKKRAGRLLDGVEHNGMPEAT